MELSDALAIALFLFLVEAGSLGFGVVPDGLLGKKENMQ